MPNPVIEAIYYNNPDYLPPLINGSRLLSQAGWPVHIVCRNNLPPSGVDYAGGVQLLRFEPQNQASWKTYWAFVLYALSHTDPQTAIFIGHDMHGFLPARLLASRYRKPVVYQCHDFLEKGGAKSLGGRVVQWFERRFARTANLVIVPDADRARVMKRQLRLRKMPLIAANSPIERFDGDKQILRDALQKQGLEFERILLRQGTIGVGHGLEKTLESIALWQESSWGLVLLGPGEPEYLQLLREKAAALGVAKQLAILGPVRYQDVGAYTAGADAGHALYDPIHVNNVHITTASNKIMEYMAAGLPLLLSDTPSSRNLLQKHACGVVADQTSPASIAAGVNTLLGDARAAQSRGEAAARAFDEEFRYDRQFAPAIRAIAALAARSPRK